MQHALRTVAIDLAKKVFHLVWTDTTGKILWRKRLTRHALMPFITQLSPVLIGLEACGGAHYWARRFREHGHDTSGVSASDDDSRDWPDHGNRPRGGGRRRGSLQAWAPVCRLVRLGAQAACHRWTDTLVGDQQAGG